MIEEQAEDSTYGVFAEQIGYAESFPIADADAYTEIFAEAIDAVLDTEDPDDVMKDAQDAVNLYIPSEGLYPVVITTTE